MKVYFLPFSDQLVPHAHAFHPGTGLEVWVMSLLLLLTLPFS